MLERCCLHVGHFSSLTASLPRALDPRPQATFANVPCPRAVAPASQARRNARERSAAPCGVLDGGTSKRSDKSSPILRLQSFFTPPKSLPGRPAFRQTDPRGVPQILFSVLKFLLDRASVVADYFFSAPEVSKSVPRGFEEACGDLMCAGPSLRPHFGSMLTSKRSPVSFKIKGIL